MAKKSSSGCAYNIPTTRPYRSFTNGKASIKVFDHTHNAEIFQTTEERTQRLIVSHSEYDNFESRLFSNGFKLV